MIRSIALILFGLAAGIALNLRSMNPTVHGASGPSDPPPSALKVVTHNSTLSGDGTSTAPLGIANGGVGTIQIANGAVTASKLGAAGPTAGQLLSFNGAGLAWQAPARGGVRVVDSLGYDVGPLLDTNGVIRQLGTFTFALNVNRDGFTDGTFNFFYPTTDCSGPRYLFVLGGGRSLIRYSQNNSTQVFFAADPLQELPIRSVATTQDPGQPGTCAHTSVDPPLPFGVATSMSLSALGLTPPFRLEF